MTIEHPPETCSDCEECQFSWYDSRWHCGDDGDIGDGMTLDNDIHLTVHENCPLKRGNKQAIPAIQRDTRSVAEAGTGYDD